MKKLLCLSLALLIIAVMSFATIPASADGEAPADDILVVKVNGENATQVKVGNEFVVRVGLYAGELKILDGQVHVEYDAEKIAFDPYEVSVDINGTIATGIEYYSFPAKTRSSMVYNYSTEGVINYNFTNAYGISPFNDATKLFARFRFKALAAGEVDISHVIQYMVDSSETRVYYKSIPDATINPYMEFTIDPAEKYIGDADGDYEITIMDVTFIQGAAAGVDLTYNIGNADVTGDDQVSLKDAVALCKYLAEKPDNPDIGKWVFASES